MAAVMEHSEAPLLDNETYAAQHDLSTQTEGFFTNLLTTQSTLSIAVTLLFICVAYDQSTSRDPGTYAARASLD